MPLPPPPPERVDDELMSRVRMSDYVPDTTARELPRLPQPVGHDDNDLDDDDDEQATQTIREELVDLAKKLSTERTVVDPPPRRPLPGIATVVLPATPGAPVPTGQAGGPGVQATTSPTSERMTVPGVRQTPAVLSRARLPLRSTPTPPPQKAPRAPAPIVRSVTDGAQVVGGRYQIIARIGQGGMGKVYKVSHTQLEKIFALKIISEQMAETDEARELFFREARLASSLSHQNIASVVDFGEDDDLGMFMVMELVEGEPLAKILHRDGRLSVRLAAEVVLQVAEALHYIHGKNIVHCDIKTENILMNEVASTKRRQIQVKLLDFGLARSLSSSRNTSSLSGTPHYVAPERIRGEPPSPSSDIYGLGVLLYELLTGKVPWDGHVSQILTGHLEQQPTPPSQLIEGGLDAALENLVLHALAKRPAERHRDMAAFIYELRTVMDMLGFGRRGKRGGTGRRVVIERSTNERDALGRQVFEACRLPLALVNAAGVVIIANPAFAKFVMGVAVEVEGLPIQSTPLAGCWATFDSDLARAIGGGAVRRVLEMDVDGGDTRRLLMWMDPQGPEQVVLGVQPLEL
jgi:tRNA A-37 threonylcarbamoyl transferase component Bud32